jgi:hypothetical protein
MTAAALTHNLAGFGYEKTEGREEWLTPPRIFRACGAFDLDPCSPINRPWDTAAKHFNINDNGLAQPWEGRVWLNPPYGDQTEHWMRRLAEHGNGIALIFARTETGTFFPWVWDYADSILFLKRRLSFFTVEGIEGGGGVAPSVLIAYGSENTQALAASGITGKLVHLK